MTILMTSDTVGGVWTYALELAAGLRARGVRVVLATEGPPPRPDQVAEARRVRGLVLEVRESKLEWQADPWAEVDAWGAWLLSLEARSRPDVVHLNSYSHAVLPWRAPTVVVGHSCVLSWWEAVKGEPAPAEWGAYRRRVAAGLRAADLVVAPTAAMLSTLERHYGPFHQSLPIWNARRARLRPAFKQPLFLGAGRVWDEGKNLTALAGVAERLPWPVVVAGDARRADGGEAVLPGVRTLGRLPAREVLAWMGRAAVFVSPARYEPFGLVALEAALAGCALVLSDLPTLREVWGGAALFVPPNDPDALAEALGRLCGDRTLRDGYARRARYRARRFTPERQTEAYLTVYRDLLAARAPLAVTPLRVPAGGRL